MKHFRQLALAALTLSAMSSPVVAVEGLPTQPIPSERPTESVAEPGTARTIVGTSPDPVERKRVEHLEYLDSLETRTAGYSPLEKLAIRRDMNPPSFSEVAPFRFSGTDKLEQMFSDPSWVKHWWPIAVTIAMASDKKGTDRLIAFIQSGQTTPGYEKPVMEARFAALGALHYAVVDQDVPSVMSFLKSLTDVDNTAKLAVSTAYSPTAIKKLAEDVLALIATDEAIDILAASKSKVESSGHIAQQSTEAHRYEVDRLSALIESAKRRQAGIAAKPVEAGDAIP